MAGGLVARDDRPHRRRDYHVDLAHLGPDLGGQRLAEALAAIGVHEHQVLLQEGRTVQPRGQHEVPLAQGAGGLKFVEDVVFGHGRFIARRAQSGQAGTSETLHRLGGRRRPRSPWRSRAVSVALIVVPQGAPANIPLFTVSLRWSAPLE